MKKITRRAREVEPTRKYYEGHVNLDVMGETLGWYKPKDTKSKTKHAILNAGRIQIGITTHVLGLSPGKRDIFIGRDGSLWKYSGAKLPSEVPSVSGLDTEGFNSWADACARSVIDRISPSNEVRLLDESNRRYRKIIRALLEQRILDSAALGYERSARRYALGISSSWTEKDLLVPRHATIRHATLVSLVLALDAEKAAQLIELAALIEMRIPFVSREAAINIYQQAASLLARLCPQWWNQGHVCDWSMVGDIDRLFRAQYIRMIENAWDDNVQFETAAGLVIRNLVKDPRGGSQAGG